jgi:hypothetical protein
MGEQVNAMTNGMNTTAAQRADVSTVRLYLLRVLYLLLVVMLGSDVWPVLIHPHTPLGPLEGVAYSFWAALSTLGLLGLRYPLKMLPLLMLQFFYKAVWLLAVALPLRAAGLSTGQGLTKAMVGGIVVDLIVIPWPYVVAHYLREPGDAWRRTQ